MHERGSGVTVHHAIEPVTGGLALASALGLMALVYGGFLLSDELKRRRNKQRGGAGE